MKKIRVVINAMPLVYVKTGIGRYVESLYAAMERNYSDIFEFIYFNGFSLSNTLPETDAAVGKWSSSASLLWKLPRFVAYTARLLQHYLCSFRLQMLSDSFDVYHETAFVPFSVKKNAATLLTVHDLSLEKYPQYHPDERVRFFNKYFYQRLSMVDKVVTVSGFTRTELLDASGMASEKVAVTPLAVDTALFSPQPKDKINAVLESLGLPREYFLFVGTNDPRKNGPVIVKAMKAGSIGTPLVIAGWNGWGETLPEGTLNAGYVSDEALSCLYSGATALVYPSVYEGFGLPVLEAMACGCPVILSKVASLPEVGGDAGCYLNRPDDAEELSRLMKALVEDDGLRKSLSEASIQRAAHFSWDETARLTKDALIAAFEARNN